MTRVILNPSKWHYGDFVAFRQAFAENDIQTGLETIAPIIVDWDYEVPVGAIEELPYTELGNIIEALMGALDSFVEALEPKNELDLGLLTMKDFYAFTDALKAGDVETVERILVRAAGLDPEEADSILPLNFEGGARWAKEFNAKSAELFRKRDNSGKRVSKRRV